MTLQKDKWLIVLEAINELYNMLADDEEMEEYGGPVGTHEDIVVLLRNLRSEGEEENVQKVSP